VIVRTGTMVTDIQPSAVTLQVGDQSESIATHTILWAAGVDASKLSRVLAQATGAALDRSGRIAVQPDLTLLSSRDFCDRRHDQFHSSNRQATSRSGSGRHPARALCCRSHPAPATGP